MRNADTELGSKPPRVPNPNRVAAGRLNQQKRGGLTPEGREALRLAALRAEPWRHSTGPRTEAGKAASAANGRARQPGLVSVREIKRELRGLRELLAEMRAGRDAAGG